MNRTRRAFDYQPPTYEEANKLTERRSGGRFDNFIKQDGPRFFKPKSGDNFIRILPNTWENSKHYALPLKIHRDVGPDKQSYLCLAENEFSPEKDCPICDERWELSRSKSSQKEDMDSLRSRNTSLIYLIDRNNEDQGPLIWGISNKSDTEILAQSIEKRQQRYLPIAHPIDGYDIEFYREGEGINTRYRGFKVARTSSPITDNADKMEEWLNYIEENPLPDILQFYSAERIKLVFQGKAAAPDPEEMRPLREMVREEEVVHTRETIREPVREEQEVRPEPNGHDDPPFDTTPQPQPPRRAVIQERPAPRDVVEEPRRRTTLEEDTSSRKPLAELRARLANRS